MADYVSVSEYARITGKDPGNIRRMLISGKLKGNKIGNQWVISREAVYPEDARVRSGKYHNSRRKTAFRNSNPDLLESLNRMCEEISRLYGDSLEQIVLYGSYARGEETPESDVDIAVILKETEDDSKHDSMTDIIVDYELEQGLVLSVVPIKAEEYRMWMRVLPFYKNIAKEGIILWKADTLTISAD